MRIGKPGDHVDGDMRPWSVWDCVRVKRSGFSLRAGFRSLASFAAFDISFNVLLEFGPLKLAEYQLLRFLDSWMTGGDVVVTSGDDFAS